jgi:hypothetical protein
MEKMERKLSEFKNIRMMKNIKFEGTHHAGSLELTFIAKN